MYLQVMKQPSLTLDQMIYHASSVVKPQKSSVVVDLPFGSYQSDSVEPEISYKGMKESGAHAVKLRGESQKQSIEEYLAGIPVMGHLGLTPNLYTNLGHIR